MDTEETEICGATLPLSAGHPLGIGQTVAIRDAEGRSLFFIDSVNCDAPTLAPEIVTAVNEHAALVRVAEAARELGDKLEEYAQGSGNKRKSDWAMEMLAARDSLDHALLALSGLRKEDGK